MNPKLALAVEQFRINQFLVDRAIEGLSEYELTTRVNDRANSPHWLLGHLAGARYQLGDLLGLEVKEPFSEVFNRGVEAKPSTAYPSFDEVVKSWKEISEILVRHFEEVTEDQLAAPSPGNYPMDDRTILGAVTFLALHETYHVGQMAYIRRLYGHSQVVS